MSNPIMMKSELTVRVEGIEQREIKVDDPAKVKYINHDHQIYDDGEWRIRLLNAPKPFQRKEDYGSSQQFVQVTYKGKDLPKDAPNTDRLRFSTGVIRATLEEIHDQVTGVLLNTALSVRPSEYIEQLKKMGITDGYQDLPVNPFWRSCPEEGEVLRILTNGVLYCEYDGDNRIITDPEEYINFYEEVGSEAEIHYRVDNASWVVACELEKEPEDSKVTLLTDDDLCFILQDLEDFLTTAGVTDFTDFVNGI